MVTSARTDGALAGSAWPAHPLVYEINTWPWLERLGRAVGRPVDLASVPDAVWDELAAAGWDAVWFMGVWERSPAGIAIALANPALLESFAAALPDYTRADVVGSPYCVRSYTVDPHLGGPAGLAAARDALAQRGVRLILDFVPNHVAPDHPWAAEHPDRFITGSDDDLRADPASFVEIDGRVVANGKDPFFPAWPDVVQLNAFSPSLRAAAIETLRDIATQCDGVRCDMAMLMMNDTFERTWGERAGARPADEYWTTVIDGVKAAHPQFRFMAEAYWDLEWALQQQGFDACYDKRLYDRLVHEPAEAARLHLCADLDFQARLLRFVENHDEPRAAATFGPAQQRAVTVTTLTQMGTRLVHDGQLEGATTHLPVFLGRFPDEPVDNDLVAFHQRLLAALRDRTFHAGEWQLCDRWGWEGDDRFLQLVAWAWTGATRWLAVVNLSDDTAAGRVRAPWSDLRGRAVRLVDPTTDHSFDRTGDDLADGLYVELGPWQWHLFRIEPQEATR